MSKSSLPASPRPAKTSRLDLLLVARGLTPSREQAQARILAGEVLVGDQKLTKPGSSVPIGAVIRLLGDAPPFVSRGGLKLAAALDHFQIPVVGRVCLDVGSSTGGFTDCLLQRGALRVYAVDSGSNQLDYRLRTDPRVRLHERTNARYLPPAAFGECVDLVTMDVSFISATLLLPAALAQLNPGAVIVILVKPQFEAGRSQVGKGGIVRDPEVHAACVAKVHAALVAAGGTPLGVLPSPILGGAGNQEFLLAGRTSPA